DKPRENGWTRYSGCGACARRPLGRCPAHPRCCGRGPRGNAGVDPRAMPRGLPPTIEDRRAATVPSRFEIGVLQFRRAFTEQSVTALCGNIFGGRLSSTLYSLKSITYVVTRPGSWLPPIG